MSNTEADTRTTQCTVARIILTADESGWWMVEWAEGEKPQYWVWRTRWASRTTAEAAALRVLRGYSDPPISSYLILTERPDFPPPERRCSNLPANPDAPKSAEDLRQAYLLDRHAPWNVPGVDYGVFLPGEEPSQS